MEAGSTSTLTLMSLHLFVTPIVQCRHMSANISVSVSGLIYPIGLICLYPLLHIIVHCIISQLDICLYPAVQVRQDSQVPQFWLG